MARIEAVILDLDGVVTRTASVHALAWKRMFDRYFDERRRRGDSVPRPFEIDRDYPPFIDGKPRYDGVRSFLDDRGIALPEGTPDDPAGRETVCGLGNLKNELFRELLAGGVEVFEDAVEQVRRWRDAGLRLAVVSSSRNAADILRAAGVENLFELRLDGAAAAERGLPGKPAPDTFLEAARELGVDPSRAAVVEDAVAGVQAGRAGGFALVAGMARRGDEQILLDNGAHVAVSDLRRLDLSTDVSHSRQPEP